jgi:O-antigen ligase
LAKFAPDSGYVRVAVELGWVGLIVYCSFFATILIVGIRNYYRMRNHLLKSYLAALVAVVFSLVIANYPQEALIQAPTILIFYIVMALIVKLKILDEKITY